MKVSILVGRTDSCCFGGSLFHCSPYFQRWGMFCTSPCMLATLPHLLGTNYVLSSSKQSKPLPQDPAAQREASFTKLRHSWCRLLHLQVSQVQAFTSLLVPLLLHVIVSQLQQLHQWYWKAWCCPRLWSVFVTSTLLRQRSLVVSTEDNALSDNIMYRKNMLVDWSCLHCPWSIVHQPSRFVAINRILKHKNIVHVWM